MPGDGGSNRACDQMISNVFAAQRKIVMNDQWHARCSIDWEELLTLHFAM
jgi:hypothetical protein